MPADSVEVRSRIAAALRLDLTGPDARGNGDPAEVLDQMPSRWYLTGFLAPAGAAEDQRADPTANEELDGGSDARDADDGAAPDRPAARSRYFPSSAGLSTLITAGTASVRATARWGDYTRETGEGLPETGHWRRTAREAVLELKIPVRPGRPVMHDIPDSGGLRIALTVRPVKGCPPEADGGLPAGCRAISVFLVNERHPGTDELRDERFAFQAELELHSAGEPFIPRPNLQGLVSNDPDERLADLQFRDAYEYAVGHSVSAEAVLDPDGKCRTVRTAWVPAAEVERVEPAAIGGVELSMDALAGLPDGEAAVRMLGALPARYREWIAGQAAVLPRLPPRRREAAEFLLTRAGKAAERIEEGIRLLADPVCREAFVLANRAMAAAARQRQGVMQGRAAQDVEPKWRPFQLAFVLMNLPGVADPAHPDRTVVDLLFFPTGGGKTEAYLGLAAFTLVLRRLRNPGVASAGVSVLMRYTLRLLTLDQLGRAATLICALELERQKDVGRLGEWPFEIGLWVGRAATPNRMGSKGETDRETARARTIAFLNDDRKPSPIPLEDCPWCGTKFKNLSFRLVPDNNHPTDLRVQCVGRDCVFRGRNPLPILAVDEPIYRRLPCFLIATVDKFAAMPWTGEVGGFFGRVERHDAEGFYGPCAPNRGRPLPGGRLPPPDLIVQDELHLISGPLGTMVGLYESALETLCCREGPDGKRVRPKIVASTATVRRAEKQIRALFGRPLVDVFPPPGPDRRDSFFAEVHPPARTPARLYLGVAAQGRSPKVVMLRVYLALLAAAQKAYDEGRADAANPADPYMTLLGYFNSLRELGGARRLIEDEVVNGLAGYGRRRRVGQAEGPFAGRRIAYEPVELTSRISTDKVAEAKRRLGLPFAAKERVDVAIATNMISVGLDITRLGLMVVNGQPKTSAEYIQATSRVGRDRARPGLVVTVLNIHKPRDRSHYERFAAHHATFYRSVEATSVTPFSPRALDRGLAGALVSLIRQGHAPMTPAPGAGAVLTEQPRLDFAVEALAARAEGEAEEYGRTVRDRCRDLLDEWNRIAFELHKNNVALQYGTETSGNVNRLLHDFLDPELRTMHPRFRKFRAGRSLRDVEPAVNLWLRTLDNVEVESEEDEP